MESNYELWQGISEAKKEKQKNDMEVCQCKTEMKGRWFIEDQKRIYRCVRCEKRVYNRTKLI